MNPLVNAGNLSTSEHNLDFTGHATIAAGLLSVMVPEAKISFAKVVDDHDMADDASISAGIIWGLVIEADIIVIAPAITLWPTR